MVGTGIKQTSYHVIPRSFFGLKDIFTFTGHVIENGTYKNFTPTWREPISRHYTSPGKKISDLAVLIKSGINNTVQETIDLANETSKELGGVEVNAICTAGHGSASDIISSFLDKVGIPTHAAKLATEKTLQLTEEVGPNGTVLMCPYSRGNLIASNAINNISRTDSKDKLKRIDYVGSGSPTGNVKPELLRSCKIFMSKRDGVCLLSGLSRWYPPEHVTILPSNGLLLLDHGLKKEVYYKPFLETLEFYRNKFNR